MRDITIPVKTSGGGYDILLSRGGISRAGEQFNLNRKCLIVTDSGVPGIYAETVRAQCKTGIIAVIPQGEQSKSLDSYSTLLSKMVENGFTRTDCVAAVGGGVVGDLAGFAAASYMRGVDFYNIPTTLLSQVDSSIGGKVAVDFMGYKNLVGAFYPPKGVIIDPDTLKTLPERQLSNGLAEAVKMSLTSDRELFEIFESGETEKNIELIIERSLRIKKAVVEADEREAGLRKILNFGHTLAHAIESVNDMKSLYHGECVALGMLPMCSEAVRERLIRVLVKLNLPTAAEYDKEKLISAMRHDKKMSGDTITVVFVEQPGSNEIREIPFDDLAEQIGRAL